MPRSAASLVVKRGATFYANFRVRGFPRFRCSLQTDDRQEAELRAAKLKLDAERRARGLVSEQEEKLEVTLSQALGRYEAEHGTALPSHKNIVRYSVVLLEYFGAKRSLASIGTAELAGFVTWMSKRTTRRGGVVKPLAPRTVNAHLIHLSAVMLRARDLWNCRVQSIKWGGPRGVFLQEPAPPDRILRDDQEEAALRAALPEDIRPIFDFSLITGVRRANAVGLRKSQVHWDRGVIEFRVKSKRPGGDVHYVPITERLAAVLRSVWDHEESEHVFTYICDRNRTWLDPETGERHYQRKGERYPFTITMLRGRWEKARQAAGAVGLRWHDLRGTVATRMLDERVNLKVVMNLLGHRNAETTLRYAKGSIDSVRAAMEEVEQLRTERGWTQDGHKKKRPALKIIGE
jgi:integrase